MLINHVSPRTIKLEVRLEIKNQSGQQMEFSRLNIYPSPTRDLSIVHTAGLINLTVLECMGAL